MLIAVGPTGVGKSWDRLGFVKLIFYTWNFQGLDYKCKSALEKRLGTTF